MQIADIDCCFIYFKNSSASNRVEILKNFHHFNLLKFGQVKKSFDEERPWAIAGCHDIRCKWNPLLDRCTFCHAADGWILISFTWPPENFCFYVGNQWKPWPREKSTAGEKQKTAESVKFEWGTLMDWCSTLSVYCSFLIFSFHD